MSTPRFSVSKAAKHGYRVLGGAKPAGAEAAARDALERAQSMRKADAVHVTHRDGGWAVKTEGRERAASVKPTKGQAVDAARQAAAKHGARLIEHDKGGRIVRNTKPR